MDGTVDTGALALALAVGIGVVLVSPLGAVRWSVVLVGVACGMLAGIALASGADTGSAWTLTPGAVAFACAGMLFARTFSEPVFVVVVPVFVSALELGGGGVFSDTTDTVDRVLTSTAVFLAAFATWAERDPRLRTAVTRVALALGPAAAALAADLVEGLGAAPITACALALLAPNADRLLRPT